MGGELNAAEFVGVARSSSLATSFAIGGTVYGPTAGKPAYAQKPSQFICNLSSKGVRIVNDEGWWECQCEKVSGGTDWVCDWERVQKTAIRSQAAC